METFLPVINVIYILIKKEREKGKEEKKTITSIKNKEFFVIKCYLCL